LRFTRRAYGTPGDTIDRPPRDDLRQLANSNYQFPKAPEPGDSPAPWTLGVGSWEFAMIAFLRGRVHSKQPNRVVVDVDGVGYDVFVPLSTFYDLGDEGSEVALRTYLHVREDALQLYGFLTELERQVFERLIGISGIGPKLAIAVLSGIDTRDLVAAVQRGDVARLPGIPGSGEKTAERIVLELRDRIAQLGV